MKIQLIDKVKGFCEKNNMFSQGERVLIGLSGGADSVLLSLVMELLAGEWGLELHLIHVNHGIRGAEAVRDEEFCCRFAEGLGLPCTVFHGNVPEMAAEKGMSEEEAARHYRYQCMENLRQKLGYDKVAVAHHRDDQAETVLFQLLRGSGLRGMGGMLPVRGSIVRPLLVLRRKEIEEELDRLGQTWCEDSTNSEMAYSRNRIRHQAIPYLEEMVAPGTVEHLAQTAERMQELADYLDRETEEEYRRLVSRGQNRWEMGADGFCRLHPVLQGEMMMKLLGQVSGSRRDITERHVAGMCRLAAGPTGKRLQLPYGMRAGKDYGIVWLEGKPAKENFGGKVAAHAGTWLPGDKGPKEFILESADAGASRVVLEKIPIREVADKNTLKVPKNICTKWFDYAKINGMLEFRHPQEGDYFLLGQGGDRKKVSRFLMDRKVCLEHRKDIWVLAMGAHVLWIPELGRSSAGFYVTEGTEEILCAVYEAGPHSADRERE